RDAAAATLLQVPSADGVTVLPVAGLADLVQGDRFAQAVAKALSDAGTPASTYVGETQGVMLSGRAATGMLDAVIRGAPTHVLIDWELARPNGALIGTWLQEARVDRGAWEAGEPKLLAELARAAGPALAALAAGQAPAAGAAPAGPGGAGAGPAGMPAGRGADGQPLLAVRPAVGAPGDGNTALALAMKRGLRHERLQITAEERDADAILDCVVALGVPAGGKQTVTITWILREPGGARGTAEVGRVEQANEVPVGALDGSWGGTALAIASGAAPGISAILASLPAKQRRSQSGGQSGGQPGQKPGQKPGGSAGG
ncbi:MAG: hypothetical protein JNK11_11270, partial [Alphaproteobacteria bacterium]|nr:hypothetical protein [Alphaproteobacteria bacterium]